MSTKSRWFLGAACAAMFLALAPTLTGIAVGKNITDFALGFGVALMFGALVTWKNHRIG
ncbi:hypothetical protein [Elongatibacter sediminis]|uniref:SPW repeat-containing protein n=1 Tax=Elongatibacter sediminis TaxID=3119006 RepID=A0AAW9RMR3_9GAMM